MISDVGILVGNEDKALQIISAIKQARRNLSNQFKTPASCYYFIWKEPWLTVGGDTFIHAMLEEAGFDSFSKHQLRYPEIDINHTTAQPDYLLLSSEPYPFKQADADYLQTKFPASKIVFVDGTYFSWYGSRLTKAFSYLPDLPI